MGIDISTIAEIRQDGEWIPAPDIDYKHQWVDFPFGWRHYGLYAFLTIGENSRVKMPSVINDYRGLPIDSRWLNEEVEQDWYTEKGVSRRSKLIDDGNNHGFSWVTLAELLAVDYEQRFIVASGKEEAIREELGETFFEHLELLKTLGAPEDVRVVFWFN